MLGNARRKAVDADQFNTHGLSLMALDSSGMVARTINAQLAIWPTRFWEENYEVV
jgi:hypothetical protein